jgi:hypothetical protein
MSSGVETSLANNDEAPPETIFLSFEFRHSFVIRHLDFVILDLPPIGACR